MEKNNFNDFRFRGLNYRKASNKYLTMNRVSEDKNKIIVKVADSHLIRTQYGYALILDRMHVVFVKTWAVNQNYYGNEVLLTREYFNPKEWGAHKGFTDNEENLHFDAWLMTAEKQQEARDKDGNRINEVRWQI